MNDSMVLIFIVVVAFALLFSNRLTAKAADRISKGALRQMQEELSHNSKDKNKD